MGDTIAKIADPGDISGIRGGRAGRETQERLTRAGIEEQRRQFDITQQNLQPFLESAQLALGGHRQLLGLDGDIDYAGLEASPIHQAIIGAGREQVLGAAGATGGPRGDIDRALEGVNRQALAETIGRQHGYLGGLHQQGGRLGIGLGGLGAQSSAAQQGALANLGAQGVQQAALEAQQKQGLIGSAAGLIGLFSCDERLKENIQDLTDKECFDAIMSLDLKKFNYIGQEQTSLGPIAQECPDFMVREVDGMKMLDAQSLVMCLVGAFRYKGEQDYGI